MKRMLILAGMVLLLMTACSKANRDYFGGHTHSSDNPVQEYMLTLADDLLTASLEELEDALQADPQDPVARALYDMKGGDLHLSGSTWTIRRECPLKGLVLRCEPENGQAAWTLEFDGDLELAGEIYPTFFSVRLRPEDDGQNQSPHGNWTVFEFSGTRTERDGYKCSFGLASPTILFRALLADHVWNPYGSLQMKVLKNENLVDIAYLTLAGAPSASTFVHGENLN
ncbi:MAG: hypothetical protein IKG84_05415 [Bacteroidales bacterium]|nr:hypothetical protein [Bacteroidales bacterium]